jgi:hypothetical protein
MASTRAKTYEELDAENQRLKEGFQIGGTAKLIVGAIIGVVVLQVGVNIAVGFLHPGGDNKPITDPINDSLNKVIAGLFAAGLWQVHKSVNSMKTELVERTAESEYAKGKADTTDRQRRELTATDKREGEERAHEVGRVEGVAEGRAEGVPTFANPTVTNTHDEQSHIVGEPVEVIIQQKGS